MSSIWDKNLDELLQETASAAPTPGGGSVSAITASLGAALVVMALEVSVKKAKDEPRLTELLKNARQKMQNLKAFADKDIEVYGRLAQAFALPKEDAGRKAGIEQASIAAAQVPLAAAREIIALLELAAEAKALVAGSIMADVLAGANILEGSLQATLHNVDVNIKSITDREMGAAFKKERQALSEQARQVLADIPLLKRKD